MRDQWRSDQPENSERSRGDQSEISGIQPEINVISVEIRERSGRDQGEISERSAEIRERSAEIRERSGRDQ